MLQALGDVGKNFLNGRSIRRLLYQVDMLKKSAMFAADGAGKVPLGRVDLAVVQIHALFARELLPKNLQTAPVAFREGMKAIGLYEDVGKGFTFLLEAQALDTDEGLGFLLKRLPACGDGVRGCKDRQQAVVCALARRRGSGLASPFINILEKVFMDGLLPRQAVPADRQARATGHQLLGTVGCKGVFNGLKLGLSGKAELVLENAVLVGVRACHRHAQARDATKPVTVLCCITYSRISSATCAWVTRPASTAALIARR